MKFGTDGVRGRAGMWPIDGAGARAVGTAAARWARQVGEGRVCVGHDTRPGGAALAMEVAQGAVRGGGAAALAGVVPTAALQAALAAGVADVGVMVTASHNPAEDNGFKVLGPGGRKPDDAETAHLEALLSEPGGGCGGSVGAASASVWAAYEVMLERALRGAVGLRRRVVVDLANGAAVASREVLSRLLPELGWTWLAAGDGVINDGCGSEHPERLAAAVRAGGFDAGLAVDGDADRCLLVDERGEVVPGDALLGVLAASMRVERLVVTVMSSTALEAALPGVEVVRTGVGDRLVAEAMRAHSAPLGGEESGHVLFADALPGGDGLLTGLRALAAAWGRAPRLSDAVAPFLPYPRRLTKVRSAVRRDIEAEVAEVVAQATARLGTGRVFIRWSGTEPVLRVLVEGPDVGVVEEESGRVTGVCEGVLGG